MLALEVDYNKSGIYIVASVYQRQDGVNSIRLMGVCQDTLSKCSGMQPTMLPAVAIIFTKHLIIPQQVYQPWVKQ